MLTNLGKSPIYEVQDGIDQGEMISPILWQIYYDPLILQIAKNYQGYKLQTTTPQPYSQTFSSNISVLAFMDDTTWVADSATQMQEINKIASSFYQLVNIKVNPQKSVLATNSTDQNTYIKYNDTTLYNISPHTAFRFLGCWFSCTESSQPIHQIITDEIEFALNKLNRAHITDKQYIYIVNSVILTRLAYHC